MSNTETTPCLLCNTRGYIECKSCNGGGKVLNPAKSYVYNSNEPSLIVCNICTGTGRIMCGQCLGSGRIIIKK